MSEPRKQRTYVPKSKAKAQQTSFGDVLKLGFHAETLIAFVKEHQNAAGYVNFDVVPRRETDQYGNTHSIVLNDWKPNSDAPRQQSGGTSLKHTNPNDKPDENPLPQDDGVPF